MVSLWLLPFCLSLQLQQLPQSVRRQPAAAVRHLGRVVLVQLLLRLGKGKGGGEGYVCVLAVACELRHTGVHATLKWNCRLVCQV